MASDRLIGHDLARYHIEAVLGRGGMGVVYRAMDGKLGRTVALKVLSDERSADPDFRDRFLRESRLLASIDHPNIVPIYEADEADGQLYIAMRYVPGPELRQIIADDAPMEAAKTVAIIGQVADALDAAHAAGLVHRDVKPGNILVMPGATSALAGHAYLTDFGLTKSTGSDTGLTKIGQFVGTPGYVAPEQIEGRGVDHRVDVYALGCILYNCLSGDVPYPRDSTVASLWAHLKEPPPRLSEHRKGLPKGLDAVITRALAKSPDDRYQTCGALAQAARTAIEPTRRRRAAGAAVVAGAASAAVGADAASGAEGAPVVAETMVDAAPMVGGATVVDSQPLMAEPPATVAESAPDVPIVAAAAGATVIDSVVDGTVGTAPAPETVVESRDAMPLAAAGAVGAASTVLDSQVAGSAATSAPPTVIEDGAATVVSGTTRVTPSGVRAAGTGPLAGRERPLAAVLAAAVLIAVGVLGINAFGGGNGGGGASPSPASSVAAVASAEPGTYVALAGDTLGTIASKLGVTIDALLDANPGLTAAIVVGQSILIPPDETPEPSFATPTVSVEPSGPASQPPPSPTPTPTPTRTRTPTAPPTPEPPQDKTPPSNPSVVIAGGNGTIYTTDVKLTLKAGGATQMRIGNLKSGKCDFGGWVKYSTSRSGWDLVGGSGGNRTVCAQFRDAAGNPSGDKDAIYYDRKPVAHNRTWQCYVNYGWIDFGPFTDNKVNDSDPDSGDSIRVVGTTLIQGNGSLEIRSSGRLIRYTIPPTTPTTVRFSYTIEDEHDGRDTATYTVDLDYIDGCTEH